MERPDLLPDSLPDSSQRAELVRRYAHLLHHFGKEISGKGISAKGISGKEIAQRPLVRQTSEYFPDRFEKDAPSLERLVRRLQSHAGLLDVPIEVRLVPLELAGGSTVQGCGTGGCGTGARATPGAGGPSVSRLEETARGWILNVFDAELHHPVALTTQLSLALGEIFLTETSSSDAPVEAPRSVSRDLACVALGLGLIVLEGSYIYSKSCGGPSVVRLTELSVGELSIACALFIALEQHSGRRALAELGATQRSLLAEANAWAASNARLIDQLASAPGQLAIRAPEVQDTRSWLLRLFERKPERGQPAAATPDAALLELERAVQQGATQKRAAAAAAPRNLEKGHLEKGHLEKGRREREELAALVDEALRSS